MCFMLQMDHSLLQVRSFSSKRVHKCMQQQTVAVASRWTEQFACRITSTPLCTVSLTQPTVELVFIASAVFTLAKCFYHFARIRRLVTLFLREGCEFTLYPCAPTPARNYMIVTTTVLFIAVDYLNVLVQQTSPTNNSRFCNIAVCHPHCNDLQN